MDNINDQLFYLDKESVKPALWSKIIYDSDAYQKQIFQIFSGLLDPRMIFIDNTLTLDEVKQCNIFSFLFCFEFYNKFI